MHDDLYERFRATFLGDARASLRDGLDTDALLGLRGDARDRAERELLARAPRDGRAVMGLGLLRATAAVPRLLPRFEALYGDDDPGDRELVQLALALWRIARHPDAPTALGDIAAHGRFPVDRTAAAEALGEVDAPEAAAPLTAALGDDDNVVRRAAARALLQRRGLLAAGAPSPPMVCDAMSDEPARRDAGVAAVRAAVGA
jgi:HEAT repeat protein